MYVGLLVCTMCSEVVLISTEECLIATLTPSIGLQRIAPDRAGVEWSDSAKLRLLFQNKTQPKYQTQELFIALRQMAPLDRVFQPSARRRK